MTKRSPGWTWLLNGPLSCDWSETFEGMADPDGCNRACIRYLRVGYFTDKELMWLKAFRNHYESKAMQRKYGYTAIPFPVLLAKRIKKITGSEK